MLAKKTRLNLRLLDLPLFFKQAKCHRNIFFSTFYRTIKTDNDELYRIAIIVPKKVSLKAVERNKLKRRAYSIVYQSFFNKKNRKSFRNIFNKQLQIVCVMKKKALLVSYLELKAAFQKIFSEFL